jgi:hypothetical protein
MIIRLVMNRFTALVIVSLLPSVTPAIHLTPPLFSSRSDDLGFQTHHCSIVRKLPYPVNIKPFIQNLPPPPGNCFFFLHCDVTTRMV